MIGFYSPPVNLHSPGPIGDVTPGTVGATTANASSKFTVNGSWAQYDFRVQLPSNGEVSFTNTSLNSALTPDVKLVRAGPSRLEITPGALELTPVTGLVLTSANGTRYALTISDAGAATVNAA